MCRCNTRYLDAALDQLRDTGHHVDDADVARFPPLIHQHINLLGRYHFADPGPANADLRALESRCARRPRFSW